MKVYFLVMNSKRCNKRRHFVSGFFFCWSAPGLRSKRLKLFFPFFFRPYFLLWLLWEDPIIVGRANEGRLPSYTEGPNQVLSHYCTFHL